MLERQIGESCNYVRERVSASLGQRSTDKVKWWQLGWHRSDQFGYLVRHPGSRCGWICNQMTSEVDVGITGSRLR